VDGRRNRRNKAAFSNFSCVVWTGLSNILGKKITFFYIRACLATSCIEVGTKMNNDRADGHCYSFA